MYRPEANRPPVLIQPNNVVRIDDLLSGSTFVSVDSNAFETFSPLLINDIEFNNPPTNTDLFRSINYTMEPARSLSAGKNVSFGTWLSLPALERKGFNPRHLMASATLHYRQDDGASFHTLGFGLGQRSSANLKAGVSNWNEEINRITDYHLLPGINYENSRIHTLSLPPTPIIYNSVASSENVVILFAYVSTNGTTNISNLRCSLSLYAYNKDFPTFVPTR